MTFGIQLTVIRDILQGRALYPQAPVSPSAEAVYRHGQMMASGLRGEKRNAYLTLLATGLAFETLDTEPMGKQDLGYVHDYCVKPIYNKNGTVRKVSYLGFQGNSKDGTFSWEIDAVKFRGRGILHFTGRNAYKMLGLADMSNSELDKYFANPQNQIDAFGKWFDSAWRAGKMYPLYWYAGSSDRVKTTLGWNLRAVAYDSGLAGTPPSLDKMRRVAYYYYNKQSSK